MVSMSDIGGEGGEVGVRGDENEGEGVSEVGRGTVCAILPI